MNILDRIYRVIMNTNLGTRKDEEYTYTRYANPNATQSEFDGKIIITPPDTYYQYLQRQHHAACHMEEDYGQDGYTGYGSTDVSRRPGKVEGIS